MSLSLEQAVDFVSSLLELQGMYLSEMEKYAIEAAWNDETYHKVSEKYDVSYNTMQVQSGPVLWRKLSSILGKKIGKKSFRREILLEISKHLNDKQSLRDKEKVTFAGASLPSVDSFVGREKEVDDLLGLVAKFSCVFVIGLEGIGKKSLVAKMLSLYEYDSSLTQVLWKTLQHQPSPEALEKELLAATVGPVKGEDLLDRLRATPSLIVLDSLDSLLTQEAGRPVLAAPYASLIQRIAEETLSKLIVVSSQPTEATESLVLRGRGIMYNLRGLNLIETKTVLGNQWSSEAAKEIWETTGGNPLLLHELSKWTEYASELTPEIHRLTVFSGLVGNFYEKVLERLKLSPSDLSLLKEVADCTRGIPFARLLSEFPSSIAHVGRLKSMGLVTVNKQPSVESSVEPEAMIQVTPLLGRALMGY